MRPFELGLFACEGARKVRLRHLARLPSARLFPGTHIEEARLGEPAFFDPKQQSCIVVGVEEPAALVHDDDRLWGVLDEGAKAALTVSEIPHDDEGTERVCHSIGDPPKERTLFAGEVMRLRAVVNAQYPRFIGLRIDRHEHLGLNVKRSCRVFRHRTSRGLVEHQGVSLGQRRTKCLFRRRIHWDFHAQRQRSGPFLPGSLHRDTPRRRRWIARI